MNILIIADDDMVASQIPETKADLLVSCGDMPDEIIGRVMSKCGSHTVFAVKGNHDSGAPFQAPVLDLHLKTVQFGGLTFGGFCGSWKYKSRGHHLFEQSEAEAALADYPRVDVFVSHNSPRLVHERDEDVHIGFVALNSYIARHQPRFLLHGHQHINQQTRIGATRFMGTYGFRQLVVSS